MSISCWVKSWWPRAQSLEECEKQEIRRERGLKDTRLEKEVRNEVCAINEENDQCSAEITQNQCSLAFSAAMKLKQLLQEEKKRLEELESSRPEISGFLKNFEKADSSCITATIEGFYLGSCEDRKYAWQRLNDLKKECQIEGTPCPSLFSWEDQVRQYNIQLLTSRLIRDEIPDGKTEVVATMIGELVNHSPFYKWDDARKIHINSDLNHRGLDDFSPSFWRLR